MIVDQHAKEIERISYDAYGRPRHHPLGDLDGDGMVRADEHQLMFSLGAGTVADLNRDGVVNGDDRALMGANLSISLAPGVLSLAAVDNQLGYAGYIYHAEMRTYLARHRWFDPELGRWLQRDPAGYVDGMNLYLYGLGSPFVFVDPWGLMSDIHEVRGWSNGVRGTWIHTYERQGFMFWKETVHTGTRFVPDISQGRRLNSHDQTVNDFQRANRHRSQQLSHAAGVARQGMETALVVGEVTVRTVAVPIDIAMSAREVFDNPRDLVAYAGLVPFLPGGAAKHVTRHLEYLGAAGQKMGAFSARNANKNLRIWSGVDGAGMTAHHIFPQQHRKQFARVFGDEQAIHHPMFLTWADHNGFDANHRAYNKAWDDFFRDFSDPTHEQIFAEARKLMQKYFPCSALPTSFKP